MGGDQGNGLAMALGILMVLIVLGGAALFALAGRVLARGAAPPRRRLAVLLMALLGAGLGWLLVIWTFYPSTLWPPPRLHLSAPPGFDAPVVILLEDPRAIRTLAWRAGALPFAAAEAEIGVPSSGIVRIRSFGPLADQGYAEVSWSGGRRGSTLGGGNFGPPGTEAKAFMIIGRADTPPSGAPSLSDPDAIAAYIAGREGAVSGRR